MRARHSRSAIETLMKHLITEVIFMPNHKLQPLGTTDVARQWLRYSLSNCSFADRLDIYHSESHVNKEMSGHNLSITVEFAQELPKTCITFGVYTKVARHDKIWKQ